MNNSAHPLISIIIVTYNAEKHLERCLNSIVEQGYKKIELIIIDGASTDGTIDILKKYNNHISYWKSEPDTGIYNAMNKGIDQITGGWVIFLGSDDYLFPGFSEMASYLKRTDTIYYGACLWGNQILGERFTRYRLTKECICHQGIFYPSEVFKQYKYNEQYKVSSDYLLNIQCWADQSFKKHYFPILVTNFSQGGASQLYEEVDFKKVFPSIIRKYFGTWIYLRYLWKCRKAKRLVRKNEQSTL